MISFELNTLSDHFQKNKISNPKDRGLAHAQVHLIGVYNEKKIKALVESLAPEWQKKSLLKKIKEVTHFTSAHGPVWIISRNKTKSAGHENRLSESDYAWYREQCGSLVGYFKAYDVSEVYFSWSQTNTHQERGALIGMNLAAYQFKSANSKESLSQFPKIFHNKTWASKELVEVRSRSLAINLARHLVNCPPNMLNPKTYADFAKELFKAKKNLKLEIWGADRLKKEKMGLHLGVGQGAEFGPCLIHLKYRPAGSSMKKPIAFVGKGITFDSGGLDIKPSSGMRLMKKDMGGSAAVLGLALWAAETQFNQPLDFYLGLAENSVDANSMRPSDVLTARNGMKVEIHNTDAEGRLVLADVLDVAVSQTGKDEPELVIDLATLTGAIKVALGADLAGLFCNDDKLAKELSEAGVRAGDLSWRMPLFQKYNQGMNTPFADIVNAVDGFGGAITAALFLEKFVRNKAWAHLDIYSWNDKPTGSLSFAGGSGQPVQCLIDWLTHR